MTQLTTHRLNLQPFPAAKRADWVAFYGESAAQQLERAQEHWHHFGIGPWAVYQHGSNDFLGACGLGWLENKTAVELNITLLPAHQGHGFASEAVRAVLDHAFGTLHLPTIIAFTHQANPAAQRLLQRCGFTLEWTKGLGDRTLLKYARHGTVFTGLATERLRLRPFTDTDLAPFLAYRNDPAIARYQSWTTTTIAQGQTFIDEMKTSQPGLPGWFQFAIERRDSGQLIGDCALHRLAEDPQLGEIGYTLAAAHHGHGFASEAVRAVIHYSFTKLHLHRLRAFADERNTASIALLERLGLRREGHFRHHYWAKGEWTSEYEYAILREEWRG